MVRVSQWVLYMAVLAESSQIETIVKSYFELQSQHSCGAWTDLFASSFVVTDPHGTAPISDIEALREACESTNTTFSEILLEVLIP